MFYRHKVLLAILQAWRGRLGARDFQKILFLFAQKQKEPSYDFVPYRFGCFSWQSYADKRTISKSGYLAPEDDWSLAKEDDFIGTLTSHDRATLEDLKTELRGVMGKELVRLVYTKYPYYATRSEIAVELLNLGELDKVLELKPAQADHALFTIGYEGRSLDGFLDTLLRNNISLLCDVRKNAYSMKYGFSKKQLSETLIKLGIKYRHIPELGIDSNKRRDLDSNQDYQTLFAEYEKTTIPGAKLWIKEVIGEVNTEKRVALMCFERDSCMCHRGRLASNIDRSPNFKYEVIHL